MRKGVGHPLSNPQFLRNNLHPPKLTETEPLPKTGYLISANSRNSRHSHFVYFEYLVVNNPPSFASLRSLLLKPSVPSVISCLISSFAGRKNTRQAFQPDGCQIHPLPLSHPLTLLSVRLGSFLSHSGFVIRHLLTNPCSFNHPMHSPVHGCREVGSHCALPSPIPCGPFG